MSRPVLVMGFDVGNSWIKGAVWRGGDAWEAVLRIPTAPLDDVGARLVQSLVGVGPVPGRCVTCAVSSVCPPVNAELVESWKSAGGAAPPEFFGADLAIPIPTLVREPSRVGTDRLLCALGALRRPQGPQ